MKRSTIGDYSQTVLPEVWTLMITPYHTHTLTLRGEKGLVGGLDTTVAVLPWTRWTPPYLGCVCFLLESLNPQKITTPICHIISQNHSNTIQWGAKLLHLLL